MDFEKKLQRAIERGERTRDAEGHAQRQKQMSEEELKMLHSRYRIELSEYIEQCLRKLEQHFPGFEFSTAVSDTGWGARLYRDDVRGRSSRSLEKLYSHLEMYVRPYSSTHILELVAKGAIYNKEVLNRNHFQFLAEADMDAYKELIDAWLVEYAEKFTATRV